MELLVHHEVDSACVGVTWRAEPEETTTSAVMRKREPVSASIRKWERPTFQKRRSLKPAVKQRAVATVGLSGVVGDSGRRQIGQEPGRPAPAAVDLQKSAATDQENP